MAIGALDSQASSAAATPMTSSASASGAEVKTGISASSGRGSRPRPLGAEPPPHDSAAVVPTVGRWANRSIAGGVRRVVAQLADERQPARREVEHPVRDPGRRPRVEGQPLPGPRDGERLRPDLVVAEQDDGRLVHHAIVDALQPVVEEADQLVVPVEVRARVRVVRERVDPVADERPARRRAALLHSQRGVDVLVHPAADREDRRLDRAVVGGERALPPVRSVVLLAEPFEEPDRRPLEPLAPLVDPARAAVRRPWRQRVHPDHADRVLAQLRDRHAAAEVVDVVGVAVVGRHHRHDRLQGRRPELRDLDRGEAAVADPPHADVAVGPRLRGQPADGVAAVERLAGRVLVVRHAARAAGAPDVEPAEREAARREPFAAPPVRCRAPVVLAVGDHLEDRREALVRARRPARPAARGSPTARRRRWPGSGRRGASGPRDGAGWRAGRRPAPRLVTPSAEG